MSAIAVLPVTAVADGDEFGLELERIHHSYVSTRVIWHPVKGTAMRFTKAVTFPEELSGIPAEGYAAKRRRAQFLPFWLTLLGSARTR
jgi:hypothetical protein